MNNIKRLRILVFDDDSSIRELLKTMLSGLGHEVLAYENPTFCHVYKSSDSQCPQLFPCADVVISDNAMPKMSGIEYLRLMKTRGCKIPADNKALMSAGITPEQIESIQELGCCFFKKPFRVAEVKAWIDKCAGRVAGDRVLAKLG